MLSYLNVHLSTVYIAHNLSLCTFLHICSNACIQKYVISQCFCPLCYVLLLFFRAILGEKIKVSNFCTLRGPVLLYR